MQLSGALQDFSGWCGSLSSKCSPSIAKDDDGETITTPGEDGEQPGFQFKIPGWCEKLAVRAKGTEFFGGNPVDGALAHGRERIKGKRKEGHGKGFMTRELDLDLPPLSSGYKIIDGQGLGILKLAIHNESRQRRAILSIPKKNVPSSVSKEDVEKQIELLLKIDHPNILTLHEACADIRNIHLVYDWPEGGLLLDRLVQYHSDITEGHISGIFREVLSAVAAANHFNVHHLDWSLLVLFLGYKDRFSPLKLFGVGLAGNLIGLVTTRKFSSANKHFYTAPELLTENVKTMNHHKLHQCDIWSCGTLLYMLCSGRPPFYGRREEAIEKIKKGKWIFGYEFDVISRESKDLIEQMLIRNVKMRPDANMLLKHPWLQNSSQQMRREGGHLQDALKKLEDFAKETHCKQTLARLLADLGLQETQYADLEERFKALDLDGNGVIEVTELAEVAATIPNIDGEMIAQIIQTCDRNGNMTVDISEFVAAVVLKLEQKDERLLVKAFEKMDMNNDARVTKGELFRILSQYSGTLEPSDISTFVNSVDDDKDKKIDYNEFKNLFPHMQAKNEEIQLRFQNLKTDVQGKKKHFHSMQSEVDKFCKKLKNICGRLCQDFATMQKIGNNEKDVMDRVKELHDIIKEFAGKEPPGAQARALVQDEDENANAMRSMLTGLAVINYHKCGKDERAALLAGNQPEEERMDQSYMSGSEIGSERVSVTAGDGAQTPKDGQPPGTPGAAGGAAPDAAAAAAASGDPGTHKTIADHYLMKSTVTRGKHAKIVKKEIKRRRQFLWLGGGDGAKNFWNVFGPAKEEEVVPKRRESTSPGSSGRVSKRPGADSSRGSTRPGVPKATDLTASMGSTASMNSSGLGSGDSEKSPEEEGEQTPSASAKGEEEEEEYEDEEEGDATARAKEEGSDDDEDQDLTDGLMVPWTTNKAKMRRTKEAMRLAAQPIVDRIGFLTPEMQEVEIKRVQRKLYNEYNMSSRLQEELADLSKLMRFKCIRSWIPPLVLWMHQLEFDVNEQKINNFERRTCFLSSLRFCVQHCEKIMFSLAEFCLWQQEGFQAMFAVEEMCCEPPATKRFLPFRDGEVDDFARTPRDGADAETLAPDEDEYSARAAMVRAGSALDARSSAQSMDSADTGDDMKSSMKGSMRGSNLHGSSHFDPKSSGHMSEDMRGSKKGSLTASKLDNASASRRSGSMGEQGTGTGSVEGHDGPHAGMQGYSRFQNNRLDRNVVRAKHGQKDVSLNHKLRTQASTAFQNAQMLSKPPSGL
mmetsp:Transcript_36766/g.66086  ORF Transcript_36766/g.66086 Transcript_36766/m.66086 type:complete len:1265 (+) Transcript_36766:84-3878(+)